MDKRQVGELPVAPGLVHVIMVPPAFPETAKVRIAAIQAELDLSKNRAK
jgi:hypothetical protein